MSYCIVIPHYNHADLFAQFLPKLVDLRLPCVVVDDGSSAENLSKIDEILTEHPAFHLVKHQQNRGKGAAVITGCQYASILGHSHVVQIDADGQHNVEDVSKLITSSQAQPRAFICGKPFFDDSAPKIRLYGRRITDFWVAIETLSLKIKDGLCGFRIYPVQEFEYLIDHHYLGARMDFDTELLVKAVWSGIDLHFVPTKVIYHENTVSHFNYARDNSALIKLHIRLLAGMLIRLPFLLRDRLKAALGR